MSLFYEITHKCCSYVDHLYDVIYGVACQRIAMEIMMVMVLMVRLLMMVRLEMMVRLGMMVMVTLNEMPLHCPPCSPSLPLDSDSPTSRKTWSVSLVSI